MKFPLHNLTNYILRAANEWIISEWNNCMNYVDYIIVLVGTKNSHTVYILPLTVTVFMCLMLVYLTCRIICACNIV